MQKRKTKIAIVMLIIASMCVGSFSYAFGAATAESKRKEAIEAAKKSAEATKSVHDAEIKLAEIQIDMQAKKGEIEKTKLEMDKKKKAIGKQNGSLNDRLSIMYKTGTIGFIDVILSSTDIKDLITNYGTVQKILESDQKLLKSLQGDYSELRKLKVNLDEEKSSLEAKEIESEAIKDKFKKEAEKYKKMEEQLLHEADQLAAEAAARQGESERKVQEKKREEAKEKLAEEKSQGKEQKVSDEKRIEEIIKEESSSGYAWPTRSNYMITSEYGWRIHPIFGDRRKHNGIDIVLRGGGTSGSPVYAISDGIIVMASWYGGYGNCVQLDDGKGKTALYGHLSGYNCHNGQYVKKGQVIGYIGSTGNSTGPHLHFTVFQNGTDINPWSLY